MKKQKVFKLRKALPNPIFKERLQGFLRQCTEKVSESTTPSSNNISPSSSRVMQRILNLQLDLVKAETERPKKVTFSKSKTSRELPTVSDARTRTTILQKTPISHRYRDFRVFELTNLVKKPRVETVVSRKALYKKFQLDNN